MTELSQKILDYSYEHKLSHLGSCLSALPIIEEIYKLKKPDEKFILSSGHAHLAHAVVMAKENNRSIDTFMPAGIHCDRENGCDVSTGSLGQGLPIAVGMALADRSKNVYVLCSDGEMNEGSMYEALEVAHQQNLTNLKVYINCNGWQAYDKNDTDHLIARCSAFTNVKIEFKDQQEVLPEFLKDLDAHYHVMTKEEYEGNL